MKYFLLLSFLLCAGLLPAQVWIGASAGGGLSSRSGLRLATTVEWRLGEAGALQLETAYIQRNHSEIIRNLDEGRDYRQVNADYLTLPLLLKGRLDLASVTLFGIAGVQAGYGVGLSANYLEDNRLNRQSLTFEKAGLSRFDAGFTLGFGLEKEISKERLIFFDFRHYVGLFDIDRQPDLEIYHGAQLFNLGILFPIKM